jgi:metal-dependent hydrolase (beta-lactamase superfamily II)
MEIEDLPPLDFVVLSHHHGEHFDQIATERLDKDVKILTEPHSAGKLRQQGFRESGGAGDVAIATLIEGRRMSRSRRCQASTLTSRSERSCRR